MQELNTRIHSLHNVPKFYANEEDLTPNKIADFIADHDTYQTRYELLEDYYLGKHAILTRVLEKSKPNNKMVDNYAEYITNVKTGYFIGNPITYKIKDNVTGQVFHDWLNVNDEQDNNSELAKIMSIYGHAFELMYVDEEGNLKFRYVKPKNMIMIYGTDIEEKPVGAIRYYTLTIDDDVTFAELYLKDRIVYFKGTSEDGLTQTGKKEHPFGEVPVIEYMNNAEKIGDFENVISLIDAYELVCSDTTNEVQYFADSYLVIKNLMMTDEEDIADMKNNRIIMLDENGEASWLSKQINDGHIEHLLERIKQDIHKFSKTPSLTDEKFSSNLSGVAIRFKLHTMEQDTVNKERKFKRGLQKRFRLMSKYFAILHGKPFDFRDIKINFVRNIPNNILEVVQTVSTLNGMVSQPTLLAQIPFVDDVQEELNALEKENEAQALTMGFEEPTKVEDEDKTDEENQAGE